MTGNWIRWIWSRFFFVIGNCLAVEDIERVAGHFRSKIHTEKAKLEEETKKPLTNVAFNRFGGGEKAMAMDVPLFGAVNA